MRDYAKVSSLFWTGNTGRKIRKMGQEAQLAALYLITGPQANMYGVYHLPMVLLAHAIDSPLQGASKALRSLSEGGFCTYDEDSEWVWVHEMVHFQIGQSLSANDNRVKGFNKWWLSLPNLPFLNDFFELYRSDFHLQPRKPLRSPLQAPSKPGTGTGTEVKDIGSSDKPINRAVYSAEFERIWKHYPKRNGSNPKKPAFSAYRARVREGTEPERLEKAVKDYAAWCKAHGKIGTENVMQAKRFFGPNEEWKTDFTIQRPLKLPKDNATLWKIRTRIGLPYEYADLDDCHAEIRNQLAENPDARQTIEELL